MLPHQGVWYEHSSDPYYMLLTMPWVWFVGLIVMAYFFCNGLFAVLYLWGGDCVAHAKPGDFGDAFFFSVHTMASIGYGHMHPTTPYANMLVTFEAIFSLLFVALATGLAFARFARPYARVTFSEVMVVGTFEGRPTLTLRAANRRKNQIVEAQVSLHVMWDQVTPEGTFLRRIYALPLVRKQTPFFSISWSIMHKIDSRSPLFNETPESLHEKNAMFFVTLKGVDETVMQTIHARKSYAVQDVRWNSRFVDILTIDQDNNRCFDFSRFHEFENDTQVTES